MKKIIIIEDTQDQFERFCNLFSNQDLVEVSKEITPIYDLKLNQFKNSNTYEFVIIHESFKQTSVNAEIISELKNYVSENSSFRLITYSGGSHITHNVNSFEQLQYYFQRKIINENIVDFVDFSRFIGTWYLPALIFKDYKKRFLKASYFKMQEEFDEELAKKCLFILGYSNIVINNENKKNVLEHIYIKSNE